MPPPTEQDRCRIENLLNAGLSPLAIARREKRAHSTFVTLNAHSSRSIDDKEAFAFTIDLHKKQWTVTIRHCGQAQKTFTMDPEQEKLTAHLKRNYPDTEYWSVYEAGFSGFEAHRTLCRLGVQNIVINPSDVADISNAGRQEGYCQ